ncbi:MAG: type II toxin-antitoxin system Phd/YefM family antitoxin [Clostridia bacterium]|nr:type II toxin-antitoxin system Phd/YefM family antitoxin [Oscillospiraceae bacterium]MBO5256158.1 type II toxin-antitoxin system Phd/YefM family antitoxin [Clostridia bacterium]
MTSVKYSTFCDSMKAFFDRVSNKEPLVLERESEQNIVMISMEEWNEIQKRLRNAEYLAKIDRGLEQIARGGGTVHELIEVDDDE